MLKKEKRKFICYNCQNKWEEPYGAGKPEKCPKCGSPNIHRPPEDRGYMDEDEV